MIKKSVVTLDEQTKTFLFNCSGT